MRVRTYGFAIPADAIITGVFMAVKFHRYRNCALGNLIYYLIPPARFGKPNQVITADCDAVNAGCAHTSWSAELDLSALGAWLPSDFNTELGGGLGGMETWYRHTGENLVMQSYADASYLRIEYTLPAGAHGDGLTWIALLRNDLRGASPAFLAERILHALRALLHAFSQRLALSRFHIAI